MAEAFPTYETGFVSVDDNGLVVTGIDTRWQRAHVRMGDRIIIDPDAGTPELTIRAVDSLTSLTLMQRWKHGTKTSVPYVIIKGSIDRTVGTRSWDDIDAVIAAFNADGFYLFVPPDKDRPDKSDGYDGQYARQPTTCKEWVKVDGDWDYRGLYAAFAILGAWAADVAYQLNQVVTRNGKAYYAKRDSLNKPPESSPDGWAVLVENGDVWAIEVDAEDWPASGEVIRRHVAPVPITFRAGLSQSAGRSVAVAASDAVFSLRKNGVQFATATYFSGGSVASFTCPADVALASGDVFTVVGPSPRDATLAGITMTIIAYR